MSELSDRASVEAFLEAHAPVRVPSVFEAGTAVGEWRVAAFVARGGNGEVYRVEHIRLGVAAAMKVLTRCDDSSRDRFRREAKILAESEHPAFPRFLGYDESGERPCLVIELLEPMTLPSGDESVADFLEQVCAAVSFLHGLGYVHRDIKPSNVMRRSTTGRPVLIDLGLVKDTALPAVHADVSLSIVNGRSVGVGTPGYSAPEQFVGGNISPAADVHALGMLANECFKGRPPWCWRRVVRRATCSIPEQRYSTVDAFLRAVSRRHWLRDVSWWCGAAVIILVVGGILFASRLRFHEVPVPPQPATNNVYMVQGDDAAEGQRGVRYPKQGVFIGDSDVDQDF